MPKVKFKGSFRTPKNSRDNCPDCTLFVVADVSLPVGEESTATVVLEEQPPTDTRKKKAYRLVVYNTSKRPK
jgi:hypothetical protein